MEDYLSEKDRESQQNLLDRMHSQNPGPMTEEQKKWAARICAEIYAMSISDFRKEGLSEEQIKKRWVKETIQKQLHI